MNLLHHHVGLSVADLGRAKKWYADVLGMTEGFAFEPVWDPRQSPEPGVRMAFLADDDGNLLEFIELAASEDR